MRICAMLGGVLFTLLGVCAYAHGEVKVHVRGTVTNVSATSITIRKGADGKAVEVKLVKTTIYTLRSNNVDQSAKASDLAVGDIVVVHATQADSGLEADEVKFSVPVKAPSAKTPGSLALALPREFGLRLRHSGSFPHGNVMIAESSGFGAAVGDVKNGNVPRRAPGAQILDDAIFQFLVESG